MKNNIEKEVIEIVSKAINGSQNINLESSNKNVKRWDSLAQVNIIIMLEKKYKKIKASDISELDTVKKIIDYIKI